MTYQRIHLQELRKRIQGTRGFIQVLAGPRQVGKTTIVTQFLEQNDLPHHFASADGTSHANQSWLEQQWEVARHKCKLSGAASFVLVIDEVQKTPNWSETVKALWDADTRTQLPLKVILLGSWRLLLQQGLTESLAGRFELMYIGHWSLSEMQAAFDWTPMQYAWFGGYPGSARLAEDESRWKKYVTDSLIESSISRDILLLTRVDKPALLRRLFEMGCLHSGQILAYTKMIGQWADAGNTTTLAHYLELLGTAGLLAGIEKYSGERLRQRASSPKFQVYNTALTNAQRPESLRQIRQHPEYWGHLVESSVGAHLLNFSRQEGYRLYYWREGNEEVDFVLEHHGRTLAIEIQSGRTRSLSGMKAFQKKYNPDRVMLVGETGLPWEEFLRTNPVELLG